MKRGLRLVLVLGLLSASGIAAAHDKWLEFEPMNSSAPSETKLYLVTGDALKQAELLPLKQRSRVTRLLQLSAQGRRDLLPELREDSEPILTLPASAMRAGTTLFAMETAPIDIVLGAEKFQSYLFEERLFDILVERVRHGEEQSPGRERYSRSLKILTQVGAQLDELAQRPLGQELELVPKQHPHLGKGTRALRVQLLFRGKPLPGRAITAANRWHSDVAQRQLRSDERGEIEVRLDRGGDWLLCSVHMERSKEEGAQWRSYWSSLMFALPEGD